MDSRNAVMETIFGELSEQNNDVMILLAKSMVIAQEAAVSTVQDNRSA